jgi:hypothetical protein
MIEETIVIGKHVDTYRNPFCRRDNLLKVHHCVDKGDYYEVVFQFIDYHMSTPTQTRLIYQILK